MAPPDTNQLPFSRLPAADRRRDAAGDGPARTTVYEKRSYAVTTVAQAKQVARNYLAGVGVDSALIRFGLPEVDDRYHIWRVPLVNGPRTSASGRTGSPPASVRRRRTASTSSASARWTTTSRMDQPSPGGRRLKAAGSAPSMAARTSDGPRAKRAKASACSSGMRGTNAV